jgi:hypothetical protein
MLRPGNSDHDLESATRGLVQHFARRYRVKANGRDAACGHRGEILGDALHGWELIAAGVWRERAVRDPLDEKPLTGSMQEFPADLDFPGAPDGAEVHEMRRRGQITP